MVGSRSIPSHKYMIEHSAGMDMRFLYTECLAMLSIVVFIFQGCQIACHLHLPGLA